MTAPSTEGTRRERTDAERLAFLLERGYVSGLRAHSDGSWTLEDEESEAVFIGLSEREVIDMAIEALEDR